jgi:hypothetical protein
MATQFDKVPAGMAGRIKRIILSPRSEWATIDEETTTTRALMMGWVLPLAAIGPIAGLIGQLVFGYSFLGIHYKPSVGTAVSTAVIGYIGGIVGVWVLALVIDALAPTFNGTKNSVQAMKVAAYSMTAAWIAGIFQIIPSLAILGILGLYSFYLLYLGLPLLMKTPADKGLAYTIVTIVVAIVLYFVIAAIVGAASHAFAPTPTLGAGSITLG